MPFGCEFSGCFSLTTKGTCGWLGNRNQVACAPGTVDWAALSNSLGDFVAVCGATASINGGSGSPGPPKTAINAALVCLWKTIAVPVSAAIKSNIIEINPIDRCSANQHATRDSLRGMRSALINLRQPGHASHNPVKIVNNKRNPIKPLTNNPSSSANKCT